MRSMQETSPEHGVQGLGLRLGEGFIILPGVEL